METENPESSPLSLNFPDDDGLWMKMDSNRVSNSVSNRAETPPAASDQRDEALDLPAAPAVLARYCGVMDEEGVDDVFIPLPPPPPVDGDGLLPADGGTATPPPPPGNSALTLSNGAADAPEANANPDGLDWHRGEKELMATRGEADEDGAGAGQTSQESMDDASLSNDEDLPPSTHPDQTSMEDTDGLLGQRHDAAEGHDEKTTSEEEESNQDISISRERRDNWDDADDCPNQKDTLKNEASVVKEGDKTKLEEDSVPSGETLDSDSVGTTASSLPSVSISADEEEPDSSEQEEDWEDNPQKTEGHQPQVDPLLLLDDEENLQGTTSLNHDSAKREWEGGEGEGTEIQEHQLLVSQGPEDGTMKEEQEDGGRRIASDIQHGEQLLQRLQVLQLRHDVHTPESALSSDEAVKEEKREEEEALGTQDWRERTNQTGEEEQEEEQEVDGEKILSEEEDNEKNEREDVEEKSLSIGETEQQQRARTDVRDPSDDDDDDEGNSWEAEGFPPTDPHPSSPEAPFLSRGHRLSAAETSMERQVQEAVQRKQKLQRVGGVFNLADDQDVLEIPFKTTISLEPLPAPTPPAQRSHWHFSQQKMQKEISQEIQRELLLVHQGTIPGGYSKGELRQLKETKLLFEAFQQDNTEGPTRHRKLPAVVAKGPISPSVLERTRSLEMFSLKASPVSRAQSFRMYKPTAPEREKSLENLRIKSPTGASRDKTRSAPYWKQDKHLRLHRSMDSINAHAPAAPRDARTTEDGVRRKSPILQQNPFVRLRPALSLQPGVEKDIRESREREEELRRQRCSLYGEERQNDEEEESSRSSEKPTSDAKHQTRGKLGRVWPPPTKKEQTRSEQEPKVHRAAGQRAPLWQRWESGLINGQSPTEKK